MPGTSALVQKKHGQDARATLNNMICRFVIPRFEGPLDLLLFLIRKNEVDISDIPIASITRQYLEYLDAIQQLDLEDAGDFLLMASTLMHIKSQMLLPKHDVLPWEEVEDPRADLVRRLQAYQIVKDVAQEFRGLEVEAGHYFPRAYFPEISGEELESIALEEVSLVDFLQAFSRTVSRWEGIVHRVATIPINLDEVIARIQSRLGSAQKVSWRDLISETANRLERILVLLALLEMSRQQKVALRQTRAYGNLWVMSSNGHELQRAS
jgi:segregation and condensation protein A